MLKYIVVGGVNGVGKSTLYASEPNMWKIPRVNTDEIVKELGDWRDFRRFAIFRNGKIARLSHKVPVWFEERNFI